ncbi:cysteate synthase [Streptomyces sp. NBC_00669]|uniref:cysteate synthase n=1 Tax=Streptomyces sp. NBC_00669 TaxID=2976011 RepID=UPI002E336D2A|nr:cysteate synthase [Streptomyces sp. NBC_00669]
MSAKDVVRNSTVPTHTARHYDLVCRACGHTMADDGLTLRCPRSHAPALLRTRYHDRELAVSPAADGLYRYRRWLPVVRTLPGAGRTVVYRGEELGRALGLDDLWIAFNGYWPERGADLRTGTFKELEAYAVFGRLPERPPVLVVPSVGNTAAAFASVFSRTGVECLLVVPDSGLHRFAAVPDLAPTVRLVSIAGGDYDDAIELAERVSALPGFRAVGGAWNVARRDGLATVLLSAVEAMGALPDVYVQAVGSAVGAIAVHEAATRLIASGHYGPATPRLLICQNEGVAPVHRLWHEGAAARGPVDKRQRRAATGRVYADELVNQHPPYALTGGIEEALRTSGGDVLHCPGDAARAAAELFARTEGIDIEPAAAVALACLGRSVREGRVPRGARVLLNITGGGRARLSAATRDGLAPRPVLRLDPATLESPGTLQRVRELFPAAEASA